MRSSSFRPWLVANPHWLDVSMCMAQLLLPCLEAVEPLDEMSVRADYEALLDRCARLMAYAQSSPQHVFWPVVERQDRLAEDDLVTFALRARRFIATTSLISLAHNVLVPIGSATRGEFQHMWRIITTIVHYVDMTIHRSIHSLRAVDRLVRGRLTFDDVVRDTSSKPIGSFICLSSDQNALVLDASIFLCIFTDRILYPAVTSCRERGVELTGLQGHLDMAARIWPQRNLRAATRP